MTITDPFTPTAAARPVPAGPDPVECPHCGGEVQPVGRKVGPHNVVRFGPLRLEGQRLTDHRGGRVYGLHVSDKPCPGVGERPVDHRPAKPGRKTKVPEDLLRRLVEEEHLTDEQVAARLHCDESTVRKARHRAVPPIPPARGNPTLADYEPPALDDARVAA